MSHLSNKNTELIVRGTVVRVKRTCGKARCKCRDGSLHETWVLSYSQQGRTRMIPLRDKDVFVARQAIKRYQKQLSQLESKALFGIKRLHISISAEKRKAR